ncbi:hypothetical protein ACIBSW_06900 [Actinoplanes sp. NPDC049668]|uniref:hypothetical protein n=1 Tax=unclassified Actinoplanes TaxID=2626549 RepID=UPI0033BD3DE2
MPAHLCESPRCARNPDTGEIEPRPAAPGLLLCWPCRDGLARDLRRVDELWPELDANLPAGAGGGPAVSGTPQRSLPLNVRTAYARTEIVPVLAEWAALVTYHRRVTPPRRAARPLARFLGNHVDWLAAYPAAGDAADEIAQARSEAVRAVFHKPARRVELGRCPRPGCAGTVAAIVRDPDAVIPSEALCDTDPAHEWPMTQWPALRRQMQAAA